MRRQALAGAASASAGRGGGASGGLGRPAYPGGQRRGSRPPRHVVMRACADGWFSLSRVLAMENMVLGPAPSHSIDACRGGHRAPPTVTGKGHLVPALSRAHVRVSHMRDGLPHALASAGEQEAAEAFVRPYKITVSPSRYWLYDRRIARSLLPTALRRRRSSVAAAGVFHATSKTRCAIRLQRTLQGSLEAGPRNPSALQDYPPPLSGGTHVQGAFRGPICSDSDVVSACFFVVLWFPLLR
jgi:hypothetical protein